MVNLNLPRLRSKRFQGLAFGFRRNRETRTTKYPHPVACKRDHLHFCIVRADALGDTILALPLAGLLKMRFPGCRVSMVGRQPHIQLADLSSHIDATLPLDKLSDATPTQRVEILSGLQIDCLVHVLSPPWLLRSAAQAGIKCRIGNWRRRSEWRYCNRRVWLSRRHSPIHEIQLNARLLRALGVKAERSLVELGRLYGLQAERLPNNPWHEEMAPDRYRVILHPKSNNNAREWPRERFAELIEVLDPGRFQVILTGSQTEWQAVRQILPRPRENVLNLMGKTDVGQLTAVIADCHALVAASTGPLHLAAALGCTAIGIYAPFHPIKAQRWGPVGCDVKAFERPGPCEACRVSRLCSCMARISAREIVTYIESRAAGTACQPPHVLFKSNTGRKNLTTSPVTQAKTAPHITARRNCSWNAETPASN